MTRLLPPTGGSEGGYLLVATGFAVMALAGVVSAMSYSTWRETRYQTNYTLGQQFAEAAVIAHNNAQRDFYTVNANNFTQPDITIPVFPARLNGIDYTMRAIGVSQVPFGAPANDQAASALLHLQAVIASTGLEPLAADMAAFVDGAASRGMKDVAVFGAVIPPDGALCHGEATVLRWGALDGADDTKCMSQTDLDNLPAPLVLANGDIIVPAWEVAIARMDQRAMMRFPQPGHPDWTKMATTLTLQPDATITGVGQVQTATANVTGDSAIENITASATPIMQQNVTASNVSVSDGTLPSEVTVAGAANIAEPITGGSLTLSGIDAPLQLTVTQIEAVGANVFVNASAAVQSAVVANCTMNCPVQ